MARAGSAVSRCGIWAARATASLILTAQRLVDDIEDGLVDMVVVCKIDRLSRSLADFARLVEVFDRNRVTFVSVILDHVSS